jgi:hypothetical protein
MSVALQCRSSTLRIEWRPGSRPLKCIGSRLPFRILPALPKYVKYVQSQFYYASLLMPVINSVSGVFNFCSGQPSTWCSNVYSTPALTQRLQLNRLIIIFHLVLKSGSVRLVLQWKKYKSVQLFSDDIL